MLPCCPRVWEHMRSYLTPAHVAPGPSSDDEEQQREDEGEHREQHEAAGAHSGSSGAGWHSEDASEEEHEEADAGPHDPHDSHEQQQQQEQEEEEREGGESGVVCVTADYAMQNVILQMGLRLCAPDGMRITRTRRWALRCTACSQVSKVRCCSALCFKAQDEMLHITSG